MFSSAATALADVPAGAVVLVSGFAGVGWPEALLTALRSGGANSLTLVCQGVWPDHTGQGQDSRGVERLVADGRVAKLMSPLPFFPGDGGAVEQKWNSGDLVLEVIPQGILAERLRAGGAGLGGVFLPGVADDPVQ